MTLPWKRPNSNLTTRGNRFDSPIQQLVDDFLSDFSTPLYDRMERNFIPQINFSETDKFYTVSAELPGVQKEDVEAIIEDNVLRIRGEKKEEKSDARHHHYESSYGTFERSLQLPTDVNPDSIQAEFKNGILTLKIEKVENSPRARKIQITSPQ